MTVVQPNIVIFTGGDMIANQYMNRIVPALIEMGVKPIVFITPPNGSPKCQTPSLQHYGFYERDILDNVVLPYLDTYPQSMIRGTCLSFNQIASRHKCLIHRIDSLNDPIVREAIYADNTIGGLSIYNDAIFGELLITALKVKGFFWNLHHGLLPEQRGVFIPLRAMMDGDSHYGCTLHVVERKIDTGNIVALHKRPLTASSVLSAYVDLIEGGTGLVLKAVQTYLRYGRVESTRQDVNRGAYKTFPPETETAMAFKKGVKLWGSPKEMLDLICSVYGDSEVLRAGVINAIAEYEGINQSEKIFVAAPVVKVA